MSPCRTEAVVMEDPRREMFFTKSRRHQDQTEGGRAP